MRENNNMNQDSLMLYDPVNNKPWPYPSHAKQYREYHGLVAWLFNPWSGQQRHAADIASDIQGLLIVPHGETVNA